MSIYGMGAIVVSESDLQTIPGKALIADEPEDVSIHCIDCAEDFIWTTGEQIFFHDKNLLNPPKRCKDCKKAKNRRLEAVVLNRITGKHHKIDVKAQCAKCCVVTTVPFYPSQGRPVYCRGCFLEINAGKSNGTNGTCS